MNQTEAAVTLMSFIFALSITHLLQSLRDLWVDHNRVRPSASMLIWMATLLVYTFLAWFATTHQTEHGMTSAQVGLKLVAAVVTYFSCAVGSPKVPATGILDLADYENRRGAGFKVPVLLMMALSLVLNYDMRSQDAGRGLTMAEFLPSQWIVAAPVLVAIVSLWRREPWVRTICALTLLAVATWVFLSNIDLV
jgi:hypothetical protein